MPRDLLETSIVSWPRNSVFLPYWLRRHTEPVHIWRSHADMGLNPLFLHLVRMHIDPRAYTTVALHLDLYTNPGRSEARLAQIMRFGVERYGARFIPALGVLNDGAGADTRFIDGAACVVGLLGDLLAVGPRSAGLGIELIRGIRLHAA